MTQQDFGRSPTGPSDLQREAQATSDQARREAGTIAQEARGAARDIAAGAREAGQRVKSEATSIVGTVRDQLAGQAKAQKDGVAERIAAVASSLHGSADSLREREGWLADLMERGARELDGFAGELKQRDVRGLLGGVESLAHRHPAVFIGSAVALGFALTRMVRGGAESDHRSGGSAYDQARGVGRDYRASTYGTASTYGAASDVAATSPGQNYAGPTYPSAAAPVAPGTGPRTGDYIDPANERPDLGRTAGQLGGTGSTATDLSGNGAGTTKGSNI